MSQVTALDYQGANGSERKVFKPNEVNPGTVAGELDKLNVQTAVRALASRRHLDVWYARLDESRIRAGFETEAPKKAATVLERSIAKARTKDSLRALAKLTHRVDGELRMLLAEGRSGCRRWDFQMGANTVAKADRRVLCQFFIAEKNSAFGDSRMSKQFAIPLANSIAIRPQLCRIDSHQS